MNWTKQTAGWLLGLALTFSTCSPNNVTVDESLKTHFDKQNVTGTFALFDNSLGQFTIYALPKYKDSAYTPASTFKIVNSLIGLETGVIENEKMLIRWDGVVRTGPAGDTMHAWNKDLTMEEAFKASAVPYYQEVARRIGRDTMQRWLDSLKYGNHVIGKEIDQFWLDGSLKVRPDEQLGLVKRLYFGELPFQKRTQEIVRNVMLQEANSNYKLAYKTGWANPGTDQQKGWILGWIEENKHPYFFVLLVEAKAGTDMQTVRKQILMDILKQLGFLEGKR